MMQDADLETRDCARCEYGMVEIYARCESENGGKGKVSKLNGAQASQYKLKISDHDGRLIYYTEYVW